MSIKLQKDSITHLDIMKTKTCLGQIKCLFDKFEETGIPKDKLDTLISIFFSVFNDSAIANTIICRKRFPPSKIYK